MTHFFNLTPGTDTLTGLPDDYNAFSLDAATLQSTDTVTGGAAGGFFDVILVTAAGTLTTSQFSGVTNIEQINLSSAGNNVSLTNGLVAGTSTGFFTVLDGGGDDTVNAGAVSTKPIVFYAAAGADTFIGGGGNDAVVFAAADLTSADTIQGGAGIDNLFFSTAGTVAATALNNVTGIEGIGLSSGGNNVTLTTALVTSANGGSFAVSDGAGNDTVDASGVTSGTIAFFASTGSDTFRGGAGTNGYVFTASDLTNADTVQGGAGVDNLFISTPGTLGASAFTNVTNIEVLVLANGTNNVTLTNGLVAGTSVGYFAVSGGTGNDTVDGSGVSNGTALAFYGTTGGNDTFTGGNGTDSFLFGAGQLTAADTVVGGGGNDTLWMTTAGTTTAADLANVTGVEGVFLQVGGTFHLANGITGAATFAAVGSGAVDTFDASAVTGYKVAFTGNGGADVLTGGSQDDTFFIADSAFATIDGNGGIDRITLTAASQSFNLTTNVAKITDLEVIDLNSSLSSTLTLAGTDIAQVNAGGNSLYVIGDVDDTVNAGNGYTQIASGVVNNAVAPGRTFFEYQHSSGSLLFIDSAITSLTATTGNGSTSVPEGTAAGATVFDAQQSGATTYVLGGADAALFSIDANGHISFNASPDFETPLDQGTNNVYDLTVTSSNGTATPNFVESVAITVTDINDNAPLFASGAAASTPENVTITTPVYTAHATDADASSTVSYSLSSGGDNDRFDINTLTGEVTFKVSPNFEAPTDSNTDNIYNVTVHASDGTFDTTKAVAITVTDVNAAPVFTSGTTGSEAENTAIANVVYDANATDDGENNNTLTYSLSAGGDNDRFNINASTGEVTFKVSPNFEAPTDANTDNIYNVTVHANDGTLDTTQAVAISVTDVNAAPVFTSGTTGTEAENTPIANVVYDANATDDGENAALVYSLSAGGDNDRFNINAATGEVTFKVSPNFEAPTDSDANNVYDITVHANDGGFDVTQAVAITVTDVNAAPVFTSGTTGTEAENTAIANVVYDANATDDGENAALVYSLSAGGDNDRFNINASTGEVTFKVSPNFEAPTDSDANNVYDITVHANDGGFDVTQAVAISVTNVNAAPVFTSGTTGTEAENTPIANVVYDANATDDGENNNTLTYSLSAGGDNDRFNINASTGEVTFKVSPNFEAPTDANTDNIYNVTVHANDGTLDTTQAVAITVTNVNAAPVFTSGTTGTEAENTPIANVVYDANATDDGENNNTLTYSLSAGGDNDRFNINASTGEVTFKVSPNFEAPTDANTDNIYNVTVHANDGTLDTTQAVAISVTNVNEEPQTNNITVTGNEDPTGPNYIPITLTGSDVDAGDTIASYHVTSLPTGTASGTLYTDSSLTTAVVAGNTYAASGGTLTLYFSPNANSNGSVTFNAAAIDNHSLEDSTPATETINVTAVNDAPVNENVPASLSVQSGFAQPVTGLSISDVDAGSATNLTTTLASAGGTIAVGATAGVVISGSGTGSVTLTGSVATINDALAGTNVKFTATDGAATPTTTSLTITTNDAGHTGIDPGLTGTATTEQDSDSIPIGVIPQVWFINGDQTGADANAPRGSQANPFQTITEFNTASAGANGPGVNDYIYLKAGTYTGPGINLKDGQTLLGDDQPLTFTNPLPGGGTITIETASGARPTIDVTTAGDQAIDLGQNNVIHGINITTAAGTTGLDDGILAVSGNAVGTLTVDQMKISGAGQAVDIDQGGALNVSLESVSSSGGTHGIQLAGTAASGAGLLSGSFSAGTGSFAATSAISGSGTAGILVGDGSGTASTGGTATITYGGTISAANAANVVNIQDHTTGAVALSGNLTHTGNGGGIVLDDNSSNFTFSGTTNNLNTGTGAAINITDQTGTTTVAFSGPLNIDTTSGAGVNIAGTNGANTIFNFNGNGNTIDTTGGAGFSASGGGTVNMGGTSNHISSGNGTALNVNGTNIGSSNLVFQDISSSGGSNNGINLVSTGTAAGNGGLHVTGNGTNVGATGGGVIATKTGADASTTQGTGIFLSDTKDVQLNGLQLNDFSNYGIFGTNVNGFTLAHSVVNGTNGSNPTINNYGEGSVYFGGLTTDGLSGTASITDSTISGGRARNVSIIDTSNGSGELHLNINNVIFGLNQNLADAGDSLSVEARGAGTHPHVTVTDSTFLGAPGDLAEFVGQQNTIFDLIFGGVGNGNALSNTHAFNNSGGGGMTLATAGTMRFNVSNNTFRDANGSAVTIQMAAPLAGVADARSLDGTFDSNTIGVTGVVDSGSKTGNGLFLSLADNATAPKGLATLAITNNTIQRYHGNAGIYDDNTGGGYDVNLTVTGNTVRQPGTGAFAGIAVTNGSPTSGDDINVFAKIQNNDFSTGDPSNSNDIIVGASGSAAASHTFTLSGATAADVASLAAIQTFLKNSNNLNGGAAATVVTAYTDAPVTVSAFKASAGSPPLPTAPVPLLAAEGGVQASSPTPGETHLAQAQLDSVVAAAIAQWAHAGASAAQLAALAAITFTVGDLSGNVLGEQTPGHITIDIDAAGHGWFVDPTPNDNSEFTHAQNAARHRPADRSVQRRGGPSRPADHRDPRNGSRTRAGRQHGGKRCPRPDVHRPRRRRAPAARCDRRRAGQRSRHSADLAGPGRNADPCGQRRQQHHRRRAWRQHPVRRRRRGHFRVRAEHPAQCADARADHPRRRLQRGAGRYVRLLRAYFGIPQLKRERFPCRARGGGCQRQVRDAAGRSYRPDRDAICSELGQRCTTRRRTCRRRGEYSDRQSFRASRADSCRLIGVVRLSITGEYLSR